MTYQRYVEEWLRRLEETDRIAEEIDDDYEEDLTRWVSADTTPSSC